MYGGFLKHRATPSHHPLYWGVPGFPLYKPSIYLGIPHDYGKPHIPLVQAAGPGGRTALAASPRPATVVSRWDWMGCWDDA